MKMYHKPVLLEESINGLKINPNGTYIDATYGGGGHSKEILKNLALLEDLLPLTRIKMQFKIKY